MNITLNGLEYGSNLITFTDIPNILKVSDEEYGSYATFAMTFAGDLSASVTGDGQYHITFMNESIRNVITPSNAVNKNFYISNSNISLAASVARAMRNCPTVAANFNIQNDDNTVTLTARAIGQVWSNMQGGYYETNIPAANLAITGVDGSTSSPLHGSKIDVDVYTEDENAQPKYVTTLEKNFYNGEAAFNLSPVLTSFADYGRYYPYTLKVSTISNGNYSLLGNVDKNYISVGYMCNQGNKYLINDYMNLAANYNRGASREFDNNTLLYVYEPSIDLSFYAGNLGGMTYFVTYYDSAFNVITSTTSTWRNSDSSKGLWDFHISLDAQIDGNAYSAFNKAFYIDIDLGNSVQLRYNVIKPIKATEYGQRILWRNSYGGISFFDFTGKKEETRDVETKTYQKNIFGYYDNPMNELDRAYDNVVKYNVTLKSHLFENDGKYIFNDLLQSSYVWTRINGENYVIILDSVDVTETDNNNIYEATIKYHYSQEPSLI